MDHVLVKARWSTPRDIYHEPDPENPNRPKCDHPGREDVDFKRKDPDCLPGYRVCKMCAGEEEWNPYEGKRPSTKLKELDASEVFASD